MVIEIEAVFHFEFCRRGHASHLAIKEVSFEVNTFILGNRGAYFPLTPISFSIR